MRRFTAGLLPLALCGAAAAQEAPPVVELEWLTPDEPDCPTREDVLAGVRDLIGGSRDAERAPVKVRAEVERVGPEIYRVELRTESAGQSGRRVIEERSCRAMGEATVLILAWMIAPDTMAARAEATDATPTADAEPSPKPPSPPPPQPSPAPVPRAPSAASPRRERAQAEVGAGGVGDLGTLPQPALGAWVEVGVQARGLRGAAYGAAWPRRSYFIGTTGAGGSLGLFALGVEACASPLQRWLWVCAGPELDVIAGRGVGVSVPERATVAWGSLTASLEAVVPLVGPWSLQASTQGLLPLTRERLGIDDVGVVNRPAPAAGRATLGVGVRF